MLFCTFLSRRCTTTTLKCLISRFVEDVNTRQLSVSFPELLYSPSEFNSKTICPHMTNETRWNKRDKARIHFLTDVFVAVAVVVA